MKDRAYEAYLRDCERLGYRPVSRDTFRLYYGPERKRSRVLTITECLYADYLTAMRGVNRPHTCQRNVKRVRHTDVVLDGECRCHPDYHYSQALTRDEWRMNRQPIGEDFPGEYIENHRRRERGSIIRPEDTEADDVVPFSDRQYHGEGYEG